MKVECISQCQTDRIKIYEVGKEYDIPKELYERNKEFFKPIKKKKGAE